MYYPYRFLNIHEFTQRIADNVIKYGYRYYVKGVIPDGKDPLAIDAKILSKYSIAVSTYTRARRKKSGRTSIHYARHQEFFVLFAHADENKQGNWFESEKGSGLEGEERIFDIWRRPLVYGGYSISSKESTVTGQRHVVVRIHPDEYRALKAHYLDMATKCSAKRLSKEFANFPFQPWKRVKEQRWVIFKAVNKRRKVAGLEPVDASVLQKVRKSYKLMVLEKSALLESEVAKRKRSSRRRGWNGQQLGMNLDTKHSSAHQSALPANEAEVA